MARHRVERTFPDGLAIPVTDEGAAACLGVGEHNAQDCALNIAQPGTGAGLLGRQVFAGSKRWHQVNSGRFKKRWSEFGYAPGGRLVPCTCIKAIDAFGRNGI